VRDSATGTYHLFAAQMTGGCGLEHWGSNSAVVRATGSAAAGPFTFAEVVVPPFAHNPTIRELPNSSGYVLFFIGNGQGTPVRCNTSRHGGGSRGSGVSGVTGSGVRAGATGGRGGAAGDNSGAAAVAGSPGDASAAKSGGSVGSNSGDSTSVQRRRASLTAGDIHASYARSLLGPWSAPVAIEFDDSGSVGALWTGGGTNPSPLVHRDGSVTLALQRG
jgi:hypothetical protein